MASNVNKQITVPKRVSVIGLISSFFSNESSGLGKSFDIFLATKKAFN